MDFNTPLTHTSSSPILQGYKDHQTTIWGGSKSFSSSRTISKGSSTPSTHQPQPQKITFKGQYPSCHLTWGFQAFLMSHDHLEGYHDPIKKHKWPQTGSLMFLQPIKGLSIVHEVFRINTKVFIIIKRVFNIINKVVVPISNLLITSTLSTRCMVPQGAPRHRRLL